MRFVWAALGGLEIVVGGALILALMGYGGPLLWILFTLPNLVAKAF
jgi:hypothetical protein